MPICDPQNDAKAPIWGHCWAHNGAQCPISDAKYPCTIGQTFPFLAELRHSSVKGTFPRKRDPVKPGFMALTRGFEPECIPRHNPDPEITAAQSCLVQPNFLLGQGQISIFARSQICAILQTAICPKCEVFLKGFLKAFPRRKPFGKTSCPHLIFKHATRIREQPARSSALRKYIVLSESSPPSRPGASESSSTPPKTPGCTISPSTTFSKIFKFASSSTPLSP